MLHAVTVYMYVIYLIVLDSLDVTKVKEFGVCCLSPKEESVCFDTIRRN